MTNLPHGLTVQHGAVPASTSGHASLPVIDPSRPPRIGQNVQVAWNNNGTTYAFAGILTAFSGSHGMMTVDVIFPNSTLRGNFVPGAADAHGGWLAPLRDWDAPNVPYGKPGTPLAPDQRIWYYLEDIG